MKSRNIDGNINRIIDGSISENRNMSKNISKNKNEAVKTGKLILGLLLPVVLLVSGCGASPAADETMQTQLESNIPQGENQETDTDTDNPPAELSDAEKEELIAQMLEDENMDTAIVNSSRATKGCTFELPEDFEESEDMPGIYVNEHYPVDAATIYYAEKDKDTSLQLMTKRTFIRNMKNELSEVYGHDVEVELESFEETKINGYPSFRILYSYKGDDVTITQLEYIINADKSYVIVYSQTDEYDRMEEFEASAATIQVKF